MAMLFGMKQTISHYTNHLGNIWRFLFNPSIMYAQSAQAFKITSISMCVLCIVIQDVGLILTFIYTVHINNKVGIMRNKKNKKF